MTDNFKLLINEKENLNNELLLLNNKLKCLEDKIIEIDNKILKEKNNTILSELKLSPQQENIVNTPDNEDILVVACPGSGKTHTLICKYLKMILNNVYKPEEVLIITFTKKAGNELINRLNNIFSNYENINKLPYYIGTIHGLAYKILQEYNNIPYTILDDNEYKTYINNIINNNNVDKIVKNNIFNIIEQTSSIYPFNLKKIIKKNNLEKYYDEFNKIYKIYQLKKKKENLIDFNDLMILFSNFLDNEKSVLFKQKIKYVFFDEYQDINSIQNNILDKLNCNVMLVGDDAQSIYSFRGSSIDYILNCNKKQFLLEYNYRSTESIVKFCQNIIQNNCNQIKKNVKSINNETLIKPILYGFKDCHSQYEWIAEDILKKKNEGIKLSDIVILARTNNILENIELYLIKNKLSFTKHLGISLLDKSHIKDFLAFVTILYNPKSSPHWKRIINLETNYTMKEINELIDNKNIIKTLKNNSMCNNLIKLYNKLLLYNDTDKIKNILTYLNTIWASNNLFDENYTNDFNKLLSYLKEYNLKDFINNLYLNQEVEHNNDNIIYLTTIHGAKGLEWSCVYLIDNKPLIKSNFYIDELNQLQEERRLFYVASSRAKLFLNITYTNNKSIFLNEIDNQLYDNYGNNNLIKPIDELYFNKNIYELYKLPFTKHKYNDKLNLNNLNFIKYLIYKIIQINFPNKIKKFNFFNESDFSNNKILKKYYLEYIDIKNDWKNILEYIYYISDISTDIDFNNNFKIKELLSNNLESFIEIEKSICNLINSINPSKIICGNKYNVICNNIIIELAEPTVKNMFSILEQVKLSYDYLILYYPIHGYAYKFNL